MKTSVRALFLSFACSSVVLSSSGAARAEPTFGSRETFWQAQLGVRSTFVTDRGFDPFATDDALTQFSLGASRTVWDLDQLSFAPGLIWEYGERSSSARGQSTSFATHRLALSLEGRYHLLHWLYGLVRVTPGAARQSAELDDPLAPAPYRARSWAFAFDASAGASFLLGPQHEDSISPVRWWLSAEGGYSYASSTSLLMHPDLAEGDPRRTGDVDLGTLAMRGAFVRIYGSVTY